MTAPLERLSRIPATVASAADYERLARERLGAAVFSYVAGGAEDEATLAANVAAFRTRALRARVLCDLAGGNTRLDLFGQSFAHPILLAPVAHQRLFHPDGECASALGAAASESGMVVSTQANATLEEIAGVSQAPLWFQLYVQPDRGFTRELVQRAAAAGYGAIVVTVDAPVAGRRNREQRAGFALPPGVEAVNLRGMPGPSLRESRGDGLFGSDMMAAAPTWRDLEWLRSLTTRPLLLKGVSDPEDARRALGEGIDGLVVSNHGGRTLDTQPASLDLLPAVIAALEGRIPVLLDGGVRRGSDVLKALALGARAVMIGRPYVYGLAAAGAIGVAHLVRILRAELEIAMALTGCATLDRIDSGVLHEQTIR